MKLSLIYFIILISLLYNASSSSDDIFKKGGYINVPDGDGKVVFNATDIEDKEEISFEIKAKLILILMLNNYHHIKKMKQTQI